MADNIVQAFVDVSHRYEQLPCAHFERDGSWDFLTWGEMRRKVLALSAALKRIGLKKGDAAVIYSKTRYEWAIADFAVMAIGGISVPAYHSFKLKKLSHIIRDSGAKLIIAEDSELFEIAESSVEFLGKTDSTKILSIDPCGGCQNLEDIMMGPSDEDLNEIAKALESISADDTATYVYTSGATGEIKGVVLTHGNLLAEIRSIEQIFDFKSDQIGLLWLPLAHVLGRMMEVYQLVHGSQTAFANDINRLPKVYQEIQPHFVCGVPRMLEKIHARVDEYVSKRWVLLRWIFEWAFGVGREFSKLDRKHRSIPLLLRLKFFIARILIFSRLQKRLGGRLECFICGGAKLKKDVASFFHSVGISVLEGYGLTETFAAITVNRKDDFRFGTVGKPIPGSEIRISADGEILVRGPTVFKEYLNSPDETRESFTRDGWFKTGDLGEYSRDGFLRITGRRKEVIVTSGGKKIVPTMIEEALSASPYIEHVMVYGDERPYLTALITLNRSKLLAYLRKLGVHSDSESDLALSDDVRRVIWKHVEEVNANLASFETIKKMEIIDSSFTIDGGELTPTLKFRRNFIALKYRRLIDSMY
ncbi:MAG: long-chain fatty acid--CoA ligase [Myxococcales bacterium]|nr:long-chain fatty acid--CoA ligase [Myxococcales bacterium]